jgi:hypothetical protein
MRAWRGLVVLAMCLIGIWVAFITWAWSWYYGEEWWTGIIPGLLVALMSIVALVLIVLKKRWARPCWMCAVLGVWLIVSPFVAGHPDLWDALWSNLAPGVLIALLGVVTGWWAWVSE